MGIQINGQTDTISSTDGSLNIGGTVTVNVTGDATGLTGTPDITVGAVTASSATISGDLTVNGTTTTLDTTLTEVDKLEVGANNTTVGVAITQSGTGDILRLYDSSTQVVTVADGGNVGIGSDNPSQKLNVGGNIMLDGSDQYMYLSNVGTFNSGIYVRGRNSNSELRSHSTGIFTWEITGSEKLRIDSSGRLLVGTNSGSYTTEIVSETEANLAIRTYNNGAQNFAGIRGFKSRGTKDSPNIVSDNDTLQQIITYGYDSSNWKSATTISAEVDGSVGINSMPGRLVFKTTASGASSPTTRMTIDSSGQVIVGSQATLNYQGTASPYNNNNLTLLGTYNIGLIGANSSINWPSDHSTADTTEPWYMMGRPNGTTDRWSLVIRPGSSNSRYNIIDCYNNANGTIESLRFSTNAGNEALRILSNGNVGIGLTNPGTKLDMYRSGSGVAGRFGKETIFGEFQVDGQRIGIQGTRSSDSAITGFFVENPSSTGTSNFDSIAIKTVGTERLRIDDQGSIIHKTSSAVDNTEGSDSANSYYHARGASFNKNVSVNSGTTIVGQCMNMLSHTRYLTLDGSTNYDMIAIGNREGCFIGHIYAGYSTGSDGAVAMYKFHTFYGGASTLTAEISPQSRSSDTISVNMVQGATGDQHIIRVSGNGYTGEVTVGVVFLSAGRSAGTPHFTVRYY